jgi:hypothetical protein
MAAPIQNDTSAFTADGDAPAAVKAAPEIETAQAQDSAPLPAADEAPTSTETPASSAEAEPEQDADGEWGFRSLKTGQFTKASRKDAVRELRHRVNTLTARLKTQPAPVAAPVTATPSAVSGQAASPASVEPSGKPTFEQFQGESDPLGAWIEAMADWKAETALTKREQAIHAEKQKAEHAKAQEALAARVTSFERDHEDFQEVVFNPDLRISSVMRAVLDSHESGPALAYYLGKNLDEALSLALSTQNTPVDAQSIAAVSRLLQSRVSSAAPTGSAVPTGRSSAPRPLTPVRTGRPARDDGPPDPASSSLDDHIRYYNAKDEGKRRRRA